MPHQHVLLLPAVLVAEEHDGAHHPQVEAQEHEHQLYGLVDSEVLL